MRLMISAENGMPTTLGGSSDDWLARELGARGTGVAGIRHVGDSSTHI